MKVAIIGGSGKMGQWLANFLLKDGHDVLITGRSETKLREVKRQLGVEVNTSLAAIKGAEAVIISVPIDSFEAVVKQLQPHLQPKQVILDITSVKAAPVATMHKHLKTELVLGTHPVFGPGAKSLQNQNIVLTPTDEAENNLAEKVRKYLAARGARVTLMSPEEHDEMMAVILGLAHFIALVSADTLLSFDKFEQMSAIGGSTYKLLLTLVESVVSENADFYASLQMSLPKLTEIEELFQKNARIWAELVKSKDQSEFTRRMNALRDRLEKSDPQFGKAYENMYRLLEKRE